MILILKDTGDGSSNFIQDAKIDFYLDTEKSKIKNFSFRNSNRDNLVFKSVYQTLEKFPIQFKLPSFPSTKKKDKVFSIILGPDFSQFISSKLKGYEIVPYMMDAWPSYHFRIEKAIKLFGIRTMFFSSRQVAEIFKSKGILENSIWMPEAIRIEKYFSKPMSERDIDVLNFGRKWDWHHEKIAESLIENKIVYWFEKIKGVLILPTRDIFLDAISRAKITICVPSNITHPDRAGNISTITWRYLQCMAARTVVLGIAPLEMVELFGYNPVIEIDIENPVEQIRSILSNIENYQELIEKNYQTVKNSHTWYHRWELINKLISEKNGN